MAIVEPLVLGIKLGIAAETWIDATKNTCKTIFTGISLNILQACLGNHRIRAIETEKTQAFWSGSSRQARVPLARIFNEVKRGMHTTKHKGQWQELLRTKLNIAHWMRTKSRCRKMLRATVTEPRGANLVGKIDLLACGQKNPWSAGLCKSLLRCKCTSWRRKMWAGNQTKNRSHWDSVQIEQQRTRDGNGSDLGWVEQLPTH
jgi:hypothetical protein